jgi:hypothetical protein
MCRKEFQLPPSGVQDLPDNFMIKDCIDILEVVNGRWLHQLQGILVLINTLFA